MSYYDEWEGISIDDGLPENLIDSYVPDDLMVIIFDEEDE